MKKVVSLLTVVIFCLTLFPVDVKADSLEISAPSGILLEKTTGEVLYEKNPDEKMKPASVTKIMTILLIMEAIESGRIKYTDVVTTSAHATSMGGSQVYLKEGEQMTVDEMLKCIVVASANDACVAMAEHLSGSVEAFVSDMNKRAGELEMTNTNFVNCTGLDADNHLTTARDISKMSQELLRHEDIKKYTTIWMDSIRNGEFGLTNTNKLIRFYDKATGLKTGYTSQSKYCISATAEENGMELIAVVMGAESSDKRTSDVKALFNYAFSNYSIYNIKIDKIPIVKVIKGKVETIQPEISVSSNLVIEKGTEKDIEIKMEISDDVSAPVIQGQKLGVATVIKCGEPVATADIFSPVSVERANVLDIFLDLIRYFLIV